MARFVIGIDLGTSNCALSYADLEEVRKAGRPIIHAFDVPQLVAPGDLQPRNLLPSSLYEPADFEMKAPQTALPWDADVADDGPPSDITGFAAKRLGAKTPVRLIDSAKSWLCHGGVNRTAQILPWHAPEDVPKKSPVEVSALYLTHLRRAWDHVMAKGDAELSLAKQHVIVTVPASFDEIARRLTLDAAKKAELGDITLIEEPLAAFYAFVARTGGTTQTTGLKGGERIVVADVGGGTTDFTLVEVSASPSGDGALSFERSAVGNHLLLGGDNMDLALAHAVEPALSKGTKGAAPQSGKKLSAESWAQLKLECRMAKETLFENPDKQSLPIVVAGRGSKLIGGTLKAELDKTLLTSTIIDGYFPKLDAGDAARPKKANRAAGFSEYGLPYASDPAITRHLADFLLRHKEDGEPFAQVDAILFNGGALKPPAIRERVSEILGDWMRATANSDVKDPRPLIYDEGDDVLELAVARGAAYFGLVQEGLGISVSGGSPREYFLGLGDTSGESFEVVCIAPRGMQDGQRIEVPDREFQLVTNRPVQFPLFYTADARKDPVGTVLKVNAGELEQLPPLQTVIKFGKQKPGTKVPVRIQVRRTELGTLEVACFSRMSGARFKLEFDVRAVMDGEPPGAEAGSNGPEPSAAKRASSEGNRRAERAGQKIEPIAEPFRGAGTAAPPETGDISDAQLQAAKDRIDNTFKAETPRLDPDAIMKGLEEDLATKRDAFPLATLRALAEHLLEKPEARTISAVHEARWLNLTGFCLRPGFGVPVDDWRVKQLWKIHAKGVLHPNHDPCELNWWILWRRVAGGLGRGHQQELSARVFPMLIPSLVKRAKKRPPRSKTQEAAEMWRAAAALEQISAKSRAQLGDALLDLFEEKQAPRGGPWCLGRIGARKLLYGPREATVHAAVAKTWAERLMAAPFRKKKDEVRTAALISLARLTGDRQFDLDEGIRKAVDAYLAERGVPEDVRKPLFEVIQVDLQTSAVAFGEGLPTGLTL